jgi:hypothetical protein
VYFIKKHIAPDAVVAESAMLEDRITGDKREIDVLVVGTVAGQKLSIGIETRDHRRKQGVEWVEQVHAKHSRLPINQSVLVSSSGFTRTATELAAKYGMQLVTPGEPIEEGPLGDLRVQIEAKEITPTGEVRVWAWLGEPAEVVLQLELHHLLFSDSGERLCTVGQYVAEARNATDLAPAAAVASEGAKYLQLEITDPGARYSDDGKESGPLYLKNRMDDRLLRVERLQISFAVKVSVAPVSLDWAELQGVDYGVGSGDILGNRAVVIVTDGEAGPRTSVRLKTADGEVFDLDECDKTTVYLTAEQVAEMKARGIGFADGAPEQPDATNSPSTD